MNWRQRISYLSIKKKIIVYCYLVLTPILFFISSLMVWQNYRKMERELNQRGISRVQNLETNLAQLNQSVSELATYICINSDILKVLTAGDVEGLNRRPKMWQEDTPVGFIQDTMAIKGYIKSLAIYPENGVQPFLRCIDSSAYLLTLEEVKETQMYQEAIEKRGRKCWRWLKKNASEVLWANQNDKLVVHREIYDLSKKNALAYLVIGADYGKYSELCESAMEQESEGILVLNEDGETLIVSGSITEDMASEITAQLEEKGGPVFFYKDQAVYVEENEESGQTACLMVPKVGLADQILSVVYMPILLMIGIMIGMFPVLIFVSNVVTKPLEKVNLAMAEFRKGDFGQHVEVETHDEVGEVAVCFNQMVTDIRKLIDENYVMELREKESELTALQAQINPHFLYNTLDSLYWQAQEADQEEIGENILALSNLFRQVLGEGKSITTVRQECELVNAYLSVQKMRFTRRLEYGIDVEEEILEKRIPKLILQPFVENAVVHGFEKTDTACSVRVTGKSIPGGLEFTVEDTGIGMSKEQVKAILDMDDGERYKGHRVGRYAIKNVRERLTLMYHDNFEMAVDSAPGAGTKITLRIFSEREEEKKGKTQ